MSAGTVTYYVYVDWHFHCIQKPTNQLRIEMSVSILTFHLLRFNSLNVRVLEINYEMCQKPSIVFLGNIRFESPSSPKNGWKLCGALIEWKNFVNRIWRVNIPQDIFFIFNMTHKLLLPCHKTNSGFLKFAKTILINLY